MKTVADVKCYHCSYVSGEATLAAGSQSVITAFHPSPSNHDKLVLSPQRKLRCSRCGGPVYLDDVRVVRPAPVLTIEDLKPRRGRPRKADVLAREARLAALGYAS